MNLELGFSYELLLNSYAVGSGTLCLGGLLFTPFALKFGRRPIYVLSILAQVAVSIWAANTQTVADIMLINAFNCMFGSLAEVIVQMTIADVYFVHQRGLANGLYVWVSLTGASLSPVAAGYVTVSQGWRWVWWWMVIVLGVCFLIFLFCYEETMFTAPPLDGVPCVAQYTQPPSPGEQAEKDIDKAKDPALGLSHVMSNVPVTTSISRKSYWQRLALWSNSPLSWSELAWHVVQPLIVLCTVPAIMYAALLFGISSAGLQVTVTIISSVMPLPPYNFSAEQFGLMSIPPFIGTSLATILTGPISDRFVLFLTRRNKGIYEPEMRLWLVLIFAPLVPAGLLIFGYGLANNSSWVVVAAGCAIFAFGMTPVSSFSLTYIIDAYTDVSAETWKQFMDSTPGANIASQIIADGMVGIVFVRNAFATIFIFALTPWITDVGIGNMVLTFSIICIVFLLTTIGFLLYGKRMRASTAEFYRKLAMRQIGQR